MIDVRATILSTIVDKVDRLRKLADNNTLAFRKVLTAAIIGELVEWAEFIEDCDETKEKLKSLQIQYIQNNKEFLIKYCPNQLFYANVNIPQTNFSFRRVWDSQDLKVISNVTETGGASEAPSSFTPDSDCRQQMIMLPTDDIIMGEKTPVVLHWENLTICDMSKFYIDPNSRYIWYLDSTDCTWKRLNITTDAVSEQDVEQIVDEHLNTKKIKHSFIGDDSLSINALIDSEEVDIPLATTITEEDRTWLN